MNLIGDVKGKVAVMVDDMIDTAGEFKKPDIVPSALSHFPIDTTFSKSSTLLDVPLKKHV